MTELSISHVQRPVPPWRAATLTECGKTIAGHPTITREEMLLLVKRLGQQRASMQLCMTCWSTAARWADWTTNPVDVIARETFGGRSPRDGFCEELRALAALVEAHPDEFHGYLAGLADTASLAAARTARRRRSRRA